MHRDIEATRSIWRKECLVACRSGIRGPVPLDVRPWLAAPSHERALPSARVTIGGHTRITLLASIRHLPRFLPGNAATQRCEHDGCGEIAQNV